MNHAHQGHLISRRAYYLDTARPAPVQPERGFNYGVLGTTRGWLFPDAGTNLTLQFDHGQLPNPEFAKLPENNKFGRRIVQLALRYSF
jgi:hypothetical protein